MPLLHMSFRICMDYELVFEKEALYNSKILLYSTTLTVSFERREGVICHFVDNRMITGN